MSEYQVQNGIKFTDADVVNPDEFADYTHGSNPHNMRPWVIHDHGFVLCVVLASNLQDALDEAVDNDKLDAFLIDSEDYKEYGVDGDDPTRAFLGNASEPFDIEALDYIKLQMPRFSLCKLLKP